MIHSQQTSLASMIGERRNQNETDLAVENRILHDRINLLESGMTKNHTARTRDENFSESYRGKKKRKSKKRRTKRVQSD